MRNWFLAFRYFDLLLFGSSIMLLLLGLLMIYSTTLEGSSGLFYRQMIFACIGFVGLFMMSFFDYRNFKKMTGWLYVGIILLLIIVWFLGQNVRGSARWIDLGFTTIQPAEFAKLIMIIIMAKFLDQQGEKVKSFRYLMLSGIYIGIPAFLILVEPDLGSALIVFLIWISMLFFSKMNKKHLIIIFLLLAVSSVFAWNYLLHDYQKDRIYTFLDPQRDPKGSGYNVIQSIIAVGSGGIYGRGVGRGLQSQLKFLPERQTDFIFASTAEELGLLGSTIILCLFTLLLFRIIKTAKNARDNFGMYLSIGIFFMFFWQILINIGMNIGLMPVTGIPLPLLSYGGSSLLMTFLSLGLVQSIVAKQRILKFGE